MCVKIEAEFFLASMLSVKEEITFQDIKKFGDEVYSVIEGHIFLDICRDSLYGAIQGSPDVFLYDKKNGKITKRDNSGNYFKEAFILKHLGRSLDSEIKNKFFDLVRV